MHLACSTPALPEQLSATLRHLPLPAGRQLPGVGARRVARHGSLGRSCRRRCPAAGLAAAGAAEWTVAASSLAGERVAAFSISVLTQGDSYKSIQKSLDDPTAWFSSLRPSRLQCILLWTHVMFGNMQLAELIQEG